MKKIVKIGQIYLRDEVMEGLMIYQAAKMLIGFILLFHNPAIKTWIIIGSVETESSAGVNINRP